MDNTRFPNVRLKKLCQHTDKPMRYLVLSHYHAVLEVVADRTTESASTLLSTLPAQRRNEVAAVAVDRWVPFMTVVGTTLPHAAIVHDKFHIVSYLTTMVDAVRRAHRAEVSC